ncbi:hypothetical protein GJAV_G00035460 [Gymnothorax javanicus]|nr:hypothetical protein GJAV_G00035460 [Gymnothorax javanicus]
MYQLGAFQFPIVLFKVSRGFCTGWYIVCITVVFGQGTKLIVTDSSLVPPSISLLPPSSEELKSGKATLTCLAQLSVGFVDVSWTSSGTPVTAGVFTSAVAQKPDKTFGCPSAPAGGGLVVHLMEDEVLDTRHYWYCHLALTSQIVLFVLILLLAVLLGLPHLIPAPL